MELPRPVRELRRLARKVGQAAPHELKAAARSLPVDPDLVVYESFAGNGMLCNPEAIFRALLADPEQQHLRHVWVLADLAAYASTVAEFADDPRVRFVRRGSVPYHRALATAGLLVNNATFPPDWGKRPGQTYLNTWHGTPLKAMGYDEAQGGWGARNVLRNFMMADYLLSTSAFMSEQMYEHAYRLVNIAPGELVEVGYPRTDLQLADADRLERTRARLRAEGVVIGAGQRLVLLAPTWKGESFHTPRNDAADLAALVDELEQLLPAGHRVLLKVHQQVYRFAAAEPRLAGRLVPNHLPTNAVLGITDVLVTDYSSIFFDFLSTGRPIVFHTPDREEYDGYRGCYLTPDELPGPQVGSARELADVVAAVGTGTALDPAVSHGRPYAAARARFAPRDDGGATQRVIDVVVRGRRDGHLVRRTRRDGRRTLMLYLGGMMSNGITSSALNLLRSLDHTRWDVSVVTGPIDNDDRRANAEAIDPRVRLFVRQGTPAISKAHWLNRRRMMRGHIDAVPPEALAKIDAALAQDWRRVVGSASFDHVVDFSGYSPAWTFLLGHAPARSRSVWQHNDLLADQMREVQGRRPHEANLRAVFTSYARFDHVVSVSEALRDINARSLAQWAPREKFAAARNTIDVQRVVSGASEAAPEGTLDRLRATDDGADPYVFVTVGRVSPEKNHTRLVEAFQLAHRRHPEIRLVVVGDGPLRVDLEALVARLGLSGLVLFVGLQRNPWSIMAATECFVLSSDYEGQPMVILEARTLGLPVVSTSFDSVGSALGPGEGLVVERTVDALADGMVAAVEGRVPRTDFDPEGYNAAVVQEFERAIGAVP
ncbi:glycosyltransferase [Humibacillus xanthopallidus]|uniref:CDP-glycerol glycerophosphotransferase (TagB/SpsB family) n=1 Tax=Humibacillus xanthopallidus TaxID=412689 RepID=A0A543HZX6_9MICO|nr:glycosyltransferase [Humibacillus xanthopallidus]TQM63896.1 CDP-glycerol glycerophosphotransferase (TagB/SpsB family) [Humibacillus xanthopallidus]